MTALTDDRTPGEVRWKYKQFTLASGNLAYQGAAIGYNPATNKVAVMPNDASGSALFFLGFAVSKVDASAADKTINVDLIEELVMHWFPNATSTDAVAATDVTKVCYFIDNQTVTITAQGNPVAGRVWAVDSTKGVLVQKLSSVVKLAPLPALPAFAAGDTAPATIMNGAVYDVPATAANSTISLPAAAPDGTVAFFHADGTKNGHTLTFRDVTTAISAATTASKRVAATAIKADGKWVVHLTVGP